MVIGLSTGSTVVQSVLRSSLREKLSGVDVDEVIFFFVKFDVYSTPSDRPKSTRIVKILG